MKSPYEYWQFWRNTEDADVERFLKLFTMLPLDEIARLAALQRRGDQRGQEGAGDRGHRAAARPRRRQRRHPRPRDRRLRKAPSRKACRPLDISHAELTQGIGVLTAFVKAGLVASNGEARRQIKAGGLRVNDVAVTDEKLVLTPAQLTPEGVDQAVDGQEEARPAAARIAAFVQGPCSWPAKRAP